jgi:hypothetical protein
VLDVFKTKRKRNTKAMFEVEKWDLLCPRNLTAGAVERIEGFAKGGSALD